MQTFLSIAITIFITAVSFSLFVTAEPNQEFVLISDVEWEQLNPARGDKSPEAGTLWGDRNGSESTGFLVKFVDGFSSPPHIHNVSYRGVVISGNIHNDDPNAEPMWMPASSFWTQPAGKIHVTAAKGSNNLAYIEIDKGPYLVLPTEESFDRGERPINVDASNLVWVGQSGTVTSINEPEIAYLWGEPHKRQLYGILIKIPAGLTAKISSHGSTFHAVIIKGPLKYHASETEVKNLEPGSYFNSKENSIHKISSEVENESIIYVRTNGVLDFIH